MTTIVPGQVVGVQRLVVHRGVSALTPRVHERGRYVARARPTLDPDHAVSRRRQIHCAVVEDSVAS